VYVMHRGPQKAAPRGGPMDGENKHVKMKAKIMGRDQSHTQIVAPNRRAFEQQAQARNGHSKHQGAQITPDIPSESESSAPVVMISCAW
jgi:hypothetical protein